jgi:hypothetical protein
MSSRAPSKNQRSGLSTALHAIGKEGGGDGGRTTVGGVNVEVDQLTDGLYHDPSSIMPGFRYKLCLTNFDERFNYFLKLWLSLVDSRIVVVNLN